MAKGTTTHITLLRHGRPEGEACLRGKTDFAITEQGLAQMNHAVKDLKGVAGVVSSPLSRCLDFAKEFAKRNDLLCAIEQGWQEMDFGDWDGQEIKTLWQSNPQQMEQFWREPWQNAPLNGETVDDFDARIAEVWQRLLVEYEGLSVLVVTHGGVMKQLLRQLTQMDKDNHYLNIFNLSYAATITVSVYKDSEGGQWPRIHSITSQST